MNFWKHYIFHINMKIMPLEKEEIYRFIILYSFFWFSFSLEAGAISKSSNFFHFLHSHFSSLIRAFLKILFYLKESFSLFQESLRPLRKASNFYFTSIFGLHKLSKLVPIQIPLIIGFVCLIHDFIFFLWILFFHLNFKVLSWAFNGMTWLLI